jgi:hypothetical protein
MRRPGRQWPPASTPETTDKERKALLDEYRKPNSMLRILISVEALAKRALTCLTWVVLR